MPASNTSAEPVVYQLRIVLRGVSPLIWRRLLVRSDASIADVHRTLQIAFGWSDEHLHRFVIHGRVHGDDSLFNPRRVQLVELGLRVRERFLYEYDFVDSWQHDVRLEQILPFDSKRHFPLCIGGRRAAPPEDCGGPWAFLELRQRSSAMSIARRMLDLLSSLSADSHDDDDDKSDDAVVNTEADEHDTHHCAEELATLVRWLRVDRVDRRAANRQLAQLDVPCVRVVV